MRVFGFQTLVVRWLGARSLVMPFAEINGIRIHYQTAGAGPAVVFAHGAGGNQMSWWQQVPYFSRNYRCVSFDHRAFGKSEDLREGPGRRAFADDLRELLDFLGIDRCAIVAQSMGGRTAVGFSVRNPGRVGALVLAGTTGGAVSDELRSRQETYKRGPIGQLSLARRAVSPRLRKERPDLAHLYRLIGRLNPARPKEFLAPIPGYRGSSSEALTKLGIPILFLVGEEDAVTPAEFIKLAHQQVPGSQYDVIPEAGHSAYFERADEFNARVERFLVEAGWV
jgi:pimeloyl-ACP methyl ester carboxylesterase